MGKRRLTAKKITVLALLTGLSLATFILESLLPTLIPGAKPGLANIFSLVALIMYSPAEALLVVAVRTCLGAIYAGNVSQLMYSFTGGVISTAISSALMYAVYPRISVMAVSIVGAVAHNLSQNVVFVFLSGSALMFGYMPYLALLGVISGAIVGAAVTLLFKGVPLNVFENVIGRREKDKKERNRIRGAEATFSRCGEEIRQKES